MTTHKPYPAEFRAEAIRLVREHGMLPSQVASDLGMDRKTLQRWLDATATRPAPSGGAAPTAELARLRREVDQLRMERDILKKALGIFSRMPQCL
jgi:transposase